MVTSPYNSNDSYQVNYSDGEYSVERVDTSTTLTDSGTQHTVLEGETLQNIAFKYYGDSGRWGDIATFNGIVDPFNIEAEQVLSIPN